MAATDPRSTEASGEAPPATPHPTKADPKRADSKKAKRRAARWLKGLLAIALVACVGAGGWFFSRYATAETTAVAIREFSTFEYPDDPAGRSVHHSQYNGRRLSLVQRDETHFDFVFEPTEDHVARVVLRNVDVSLMTPGLPNYPAWDDGLRRIALTDREWNRQQVQFYVGAESIEISGGDGWEQQNLKVVSLAKNCLNAGLWEVLLSEQTDAGKKMYYQGWFTFPMGHYKRLWERNTGLSYWEDYNFWRMEHWVDPAGNRIDLTKLREVIDEQPVQVAFDSEEEIWFAGEQVRKRRTALASGVRTWGDFVERREDVRFATFVPPGVYDVDTPWENRYDLIAQFEQGVHRRVRSALNGRTLDELELIYESEAGAPTRIVIGGLDFAAAPKLARGDYPSGRYLPMGVGVPPFYQDYHELTASPPTESPYYCFVLDEDSAWVDHHTMAIDGPVLHLDRGDPTLLHVYLLSYERHQIVAHYAVRLPGGDAAPSGEIADRRANEPEAPVR